MEAHLLECQIATQERDTWQIGRLQAAEEIAQLAALTNNEKEALGLQVCLFFKCESKIFYWPCLLEDLYKSESRNGNKASQDCRKILGERVRGYIKRLNR
jgi:hypothetical protein